MKTGIFGGAFDPIHKGHIYMAQKAMEEYSLDRILLVPSGHSPNKTENAMTAFSHRYNMCKLAARAVPGILAAEITVRAVFSRRHGNLTMESRLMNRYKTRYSTRLSLSMCRELPF